MTGPRPMFPLGAVLLPGAVLPLHVFEPRYRALTRVCLAGDRQFGVVLIERGSEVGGGDVRAGVGTMARIVNAAELGDGRFALTAVGTERIRVSLWLEDDPYPRAEVAPWPDPEPGPEAAGALAAVVGRLRQVLALRAELGDPAPPATTPVAGEPTLASYQVAALAPLGPADRHELLASPSVGERLARLAALLDDEADFLARRLGLEGDPG